MKVSKIGECFFGFSVVVVLVVLIVEVVLVAVVLVVVVRGVSLSLFELAPLRLGIISIGYGRKVVVE